MSENAKNIAEIERLERLLAEVRKQVGAPSNNAATINVNAGGIGIWIVSCMACFMFGLNLLLFFVVIGQQREIDDLNHYLQAIYQAAPYLQPEK